MAAHVFIPLIAIGSLALIGAVVAVIQPRIAWVRWLGATLLFGTGLTGCVLFVMNDAG